VVIVRRVSVIFVMCLSLMVTLVAPALAVEESAMTKEQCVAYEHETFISESSAPVCEEKYPIPASWKVVVPAKEVSKSGIQIILAVLGSIVALIVLMIICKKTVKLNQSHDGKLVR
jgi:hypothetical protein